MSRKIPCEKKKSPEPHHWLIAGSTSKGWGNTITEGKCKKCGYTGKELDREFYNYKEYGGKVTGSINGKPRTKAIDKQDETPWRVWKHD